VHATKTVTKRARGTRIEGRRKREGGRERATRSKGLFRKAAAHLKIHVSYFLPFAFSEKDCLALLDSACFVEEASLHACFTKRSL